jgi:hypothetical protein
MKVVHFFCIVLFLLMRFGAHAQPTSLMVISNLKGAPNELKGPELKAVLKGERQRWRNGYKIVIALMKTDTDVGKYTSEKIYNMSGNELKKYWLSLVFQGKADAPVFFNTIGELEKFVAENPGAIGIVDQGASFASTQVVLIDGRRTL